MSKRLDTTNKMRSPGPGEYEAIERVTNRNNAHKIGTS